MPRATARATDREPNDDGELRKRFEEQTRQFEQVRGELTSVRGLMAQKDDELDRLRGQVVELNRQVGTLEARLERMPALENELKETRAQLLESLQQREADIAEAVKDITQKFETERAGWTQERGQLTDQINALRVENEKLKEQIEGGGTEATTSTPEAIAGQFARVLENLQVDASTRTDRPVVGTLRGFDVELKGVLQSTAEETNLVMPPPGKVDPNQLSTLRMSFATIPTLQRVAAQPPIAREMQPREQAAEEAKPPDQPPEEQKGKESPAKKRRGASAKGKKRS